MCASVQAHRRQHAPLAGARGREHLGAQMPRELHRRHPDAARRRMHQHPLARPQPRPDPPARTTPSVNTTGTAAACANDHPSGIRASSRASVTATGPNPPRSAHHPVTGSQALDPRTDLQHHTGTLAAHDRLIRVHPQRDQHIAEVQTPPHALRHAPHPRQARPAQQGRAINSASREPPAPASKRQSSPAGTASPPAAPSRTSRATNASPPRTTTCGSAKSTAPPSALQEASSPSRSTSPNRPGLSASAERTKPHTPAMLKSTVSPGRAATPLRHKHQTRSGEPLIRQPLLSQRQNITQHTTHTLDAAGPTPRRGSAVDEHHRGHIPTVSERETITQHHPGRIALNGFDRRGDPTQGEQRLTTTSSSQLSSGHLAHHQGIDRADEHPHLVSDGQRNRPITRG